MKSELLARLQQLRATGVPVALVTRLVDGAQALLTDSAREGDLTFDETVARDVRLRLRGDASGEVGAGLFARVYAPPLRMILVGAVHVAQALVKMAPGAGFSVTVIDPRTAFATQDRFPDATLVTAWPDAAMTQLRPDSRTAVITLTHDPKLDDPALLQALRSDAFFIGALGSRKTHAARLARLAAQGMTDAELARIHAPVGLPLGGRRPGEIAVAVLAQVIQTLHGNHPP
ncbi:MAG: XdhC family protein [Gammaproteobacteria bacterium]|nr:XdhC family protein [Gammaproteobacteria bacterium]